MKRIFILTNMVCILCVGSLFAQGPEDDPNQNNPQDNSQNDNRYPIQNPGDTAYPNPVDNRTMNSDPAAGGYPGSVGYSNPGPGQGTGSYNGPGTPSDQGAGANNTYADPYPNRGPAGPDGRPPEEMMRNTSPGPMVSTGDIVMDYRSLVQRIDDMRVHEDEVLRKLEDLSRSYEDGLKKLDDTNEKLEAKIKEIQDWYDKVFDKMEKMNTSWSQPQEIHGEVRGAPSDRYSTK